ncbi:GTP pyrophosphokinase rsh [compost metagenome]
MSKYDLALGMCIGAHEGSGQKRKYTNEHYWNHPIEVSQIVASVPHTEEMVIAALGHDQLEDTKMTSETIERFFGPVVLELILGLTDVSKPEDGNRAKRKEADRNHTAMQSPECKTIKLADLISNSKSICEHDKDFAKVYIKEKELLLEVLTEGDPTLYAQARGIVEKAKKELGIE